VHEVRRAFRHDVDADDPAAFRSGNQLQHATLMPGDVCPRDLAKIRAPDQDSTMPLAHLGLGKPHAGEFLTPGIDFDPERGSSYLRFCYAGPEHRMREAARRIASWLKRK
jgi:hypothetical protein